MSGEYTEITETGRDGCITTTMRVGGRVVCSYTSPAYVGMAGHVCDAEPIIATVIESWGICPDCLGSGEGHDPGGDRDVEPCHCVAERMAEHRAEDAADELSGRYAWGEP